MNVDQFRAQLFHQQGVVLVGDEVEAEGVGERGIALGEVGTSLLTNGGCSATHKPDRSNA